MPGTTTPQVREQITVTHLQLADRLAQPYRHAGATLDDLRRTARAGLVAAVDRFQPEWARPLRPLPSPA
jgi:DNA-directed RNA polymerase specialized sigma subunit